MARSLRLWSVDARFDAVGLALVAALAVWVRFFAGDGAGRPAPVLWLLGGIVWAFALGRSSVFPAGVVPGALAVAIVGSVALTWPELLGSSGAPTGYANSNATLTSLGVIAASGAAEHAGPGAERRCWVALASALAAATVATGSCAGVAALAVALALLTSSRVARWPAFVIVGGLIAVSVAMGLTVALALGADLGGLGEGAGVRRELWSAAAQLARENPISGVGPGEFAAVTPVSGDADLRWAHHGLLQIAAELGAVGLVLALSLAAWTWTSLWRATRSSVAGPCLAGTAMAIVGLHAAVDYVLHAAAVVVVLAALAGSATAPGTRHSRGP